MRRFLPQRVLSVGARGLGDPSRVQAWAINGALSSDDSYNVTGMTALGTGTVRVTFDRDMANASYAVWTTALTSGHKASVAARAVGSVDIALTLASSATPGAATLFSVVVAGRS